jgi:hypothetical protein
VSRHTPSETITRLADTKMRFYAPTFWSLCRDTSSSAAPTTGAARKLASP